MIHLIVYGYIILLCMHVSMLSHFSCVRLFVTPWTVACQAPLSVDSQGKNTGVGCRLLLWGILLTWWSNPGLLCISYTIIRKWTLYSIRCSIPIYFLNLKVKLRPSFPSSQRNHPSFASVGCQALTRKLLLLPTVKKCRDFYNPSYSVKEANLKRG